MSTGFQELRSEQLTDALAAILIPKFVGILQTRSLGHCMRVAHLEQPVMECLVVALRSELKRLQISAEVYILSQDTTQQPSDLLITSTKLVELRNPLPDQSLRSPLLVFLPRDLQTNAEDSFNVASFEDIPVGSVYADLTKKLLKEISPNFQGHIHEIFNKLSQEKWQWATPINQIRYLLTARSNGIDGDTLGAGLYELGLVPDFHLFDDPTTVQTRLVRNLEAMRKLSSDSTLTLRGRVLSLRLLDDNLRDRIIQILLSHEADSPSNWTKQIVLDKNNWELDFTGWTRQEDIEAGKIQIEIKNLDLPYANETSAYSRLLSLVGSQYLAAKYQKEIKGEVTVSSTPVAGLSYFTVQTISRASGPIGSPKKVKAGKAFKSFTLDKLDKIEFDEGWHYVRVLAWTESGIPIPLELAKTDSSNNIIPNESEDFYVLPDGELEEDAIAVSTKIIESFAHLQFKLQLEAIANKQSVDKISIGSPIWNEATGNKKSAGEELEIRCGKFGKFGVSVSSQLKWIERKILQSPEKLGIWKQSLPNSESLFVLQEWQIHHPTAMFKTFVDARRRYFHHFTSGEFAHIAQSIDWLSAEQLCLEYAATYNAWLDELKQCLEKNPEAAYKHELLQDLRQALSIDAVCLKWGNSLSHYQEAILVGPTHPLRALWFLAWTKISQDWINRSLTDREFSISILDSIQLANPTSIPAFYPLEDGRIFSTIDNLTPFWSVYAPPNTADIQGLIIQICQTLEIPQASRTGSSNIKAGVLADKVSRYLAQHPYIQTLAINIFNLSRADLLAEVLSLVRKQVSHRSLYFDIRVFANSPDLIGIEEYVETLSHVASEDFNVHQIGPSVVSSSLFPKFSLSIHQNAEFENVPESYPAHISMLFNAFPVATVEVLPEFTFNENPSLYGLMQDFAVQFEQDNAGTRWYRQPLCKLGSNASTLEDALSCFHHARLATVEAIATIATGRPSFNKRPTITLSLSPKEQKFIHQIHSSSDWVLTVDRNLGIEFFDQDISTDTPAYLVDYVPDNNSGFGHQLLVTSRSLTELESILLNLLASRGLKVDQNQCAIILNQLRSLSGRLALKLISSSSHQAEVLGLALARLFLASQRALKNQAILPIDTHVDLFRTAQRQADRLGEQLKLQRTDLALFHLNLAERSIQFNLVEVKCYSNVGSLSDYQKLKDGIIQQLESTEQVLKHHFDCHSRPDQMWKASELSSLLAFYLNRAERYQLILADFVQEAKILLSTLEQGYELKFSRSALIFDFSQEESYFSEQEADVEFHHIGRDLIKELVETPDYYKSLLTGSLGILSSLPLHSIDSAAFLVPERDYSLVGNTLTEEIAPTQVHQPQPRNQSSTFHPLSSESSSS
jgi:DNA phosphorothioation-dependent restriction protein DptH